MDIYNEIRMMALELPETMSTREICPVCEGGTSKEKSLHIRRMEGGNLYAACYRASCSFSPHVVPSDKGTITTISNSTAFRKQEKNYYKKDLELLPDSVVQYLKRFAYSALEQSSPQDIDCKLGMQQVDERESSFYKKEGWRYSREDHALVMPLKDIHGTEFAIGVKPLPLSPCKWKYMTYYSDKKAPNIHYPRITRTCYHSWLTEKVRPEIQRTCVITEDIISATRMSTLLPSVAINGTHIGDKEVVSLMRNYDHIVVALDKDTWENVHVSKGQRFKQEYGFCFKSFKVLKLEKDPKYLTDEEWRVICGKQGISSSYTE
tara:strand:- start:10639 stop:11598 length:960 start_codon:yes stop_codon:yes gene_type:complete